MSDFNTWNESLIEAVRKSSLFENGGAEAGVSLCSQCEEIIAALEGVLPTLIDSGERVLTLEAIKAIKEGRQQEANIAEAFVWTVTPQGGDWWADQDFFLDEYLPPHNCIRDGHDE